VKAKLAARRAAVERGFAAETREAVSGAAAEHDRSGHKFERDRQPLLPKATRAATAGEMLRRQTPVVCRWSCAVLRPCVKLVHTRSTGRLPPT